VLQRKINCKEFRPQRLLQSIIKRSRHYKKTQVLTKDEKIQLEEQKIYKTENRREKETTRRTRTHGDNTTAAWHTKEAAASPTNDWSFV